MLSSLFGRKANDVERVVRIFFGPASTIVVPMHRSSTGVHFEQNGVAVLAASATPDQLGDAFSRAFAAFSVVPYGVPFARRSDWPAFKASGYRSMKEFERCYVPMLCASLNASNAVVRACVPHPSEADLEVAWHFNPVLAAGAVGEGLLRLVRTARES